MEKEQITVLGVGNILYTDEGFGIRVVEKMMEEYEFGENISLVDGGVLGMNLLGYISWADQLIVVDGVRNNGTPGDMYRIEAADIPQRVRAKNSLHQIDLLEALTLCQALEKVPETVILGIEPEDMETLGVEMTRTAKEKVEPMIEKVLAELDRLGGTYRKRSTNNVPGNTFQDCGDQRHQGNC